MFSKVDDSLVLGGFMTLVTRNSKVSVDVPETLMVTLSVEPETVQDKLLPVW